MNIASLDTIIGSTSSSCFARKSTTRRAKRLDTWSFWKIASRCTCWSWWPTRRRKRRICRSRWSRRMSRCATSHSKSTKSSRRTRTSWPTWSKRTGSREISKSHGKRTWTTTSFCPISILNNTNRHKLNKAQTKGKTWGRQPRQEWCLESDRTLRQWGVCKSSVSL